MPSLGAGFQAGSQNALVGAAAGLLPRTWAGKVSSDADPAEDLAGVLAGQAGALERVRPRRCDAVAQQTGLPGGGVHVDRPLAAFAAADHPTPVAQGCREILVRADR